jgi:hypothetical protein
MEGDEALARLEERVERGLFHDWLEAGEALLEIRDERLYMPEYRTFGKYVEARYEIHRTTAAGIMSAAVVMRDVSACAEIRLTQRHAQLLYPFDDTDTRVSLAREIAMLTYRNAELLVSERAQQEDKTKGARKQSRQEEDEQLHALVSALRTIRALATDEVVDRLGELAPPHRLKLEREIQAAVRHLNSVQHHGDERVRDRSRFREG